MALSAVAYGASCLHLTASVLEHQLSYKGSIKTDLPMPSWGTQCDTAPLHNCYAQLQMQGNHTDKLQVAVKHSGPTHNIMICLGLF